MAKRQIRIREAITDVRSGMTDAELMDKYQLAAKGLQSLFAKLVAARLITMKELEQRMPGFMPSATLSGDFDLSTAQEDWRITWQKPGQKAGQLVNAREALADIRAGLTDSELMDKYRLTSKGMQDLLEQLLGAKLITKEELDQRMPSADSTVDLRGMIEGLNWDEMIRELEDPSEAGHKCPSCGVAYDRLMSACPSCGYSSSRGKKKPAAKKPAEASTPAPASPPRPVPDPTGPPALKAPPPKPPRARPLDSLDLNKVVEDVRAGLPDGELMDRYRISFLELDEIFNKLLDANLITKGELYGRSSFFSETLAIDPIPESSAHYLAFPIPITDAMNPKIVGRLRNVAETEVGVVGIESKVGDTRSFVVFPEKFVDIQAITFDGTCNWAAKQAEGFYARFEITYISDRDKVRLKKMIDALTFSL